MDYSKIATIINKIRNLEMELKNELRGMDLGPNDQPKNSVATAPMPAHGSKKDKSLKLVDWLKANVSNGGIGYAELMAGYRKATGRSGQSAGQQLRYLTEEKVVTYDRVSGIVKLR
jgi:hypothetical protein